MSDVWAAWTECPNSMCIAEFRCMWPDACSSAPAEPVGGTNTYSPTHPHEPAIPPCLAEDGHCRICRLLLNLTDAEKRAEKAEREVAELREKYDELIMSVATKWEGESRHATARRYIRQRESYQGGSSMCAKWDDAAHQEELKEGK